MPKGISDGRCHGTDAMNNISKEEMSERGRRGGLASVEARRKRKDFKNTIELLLGMSIKGGKVSDIEEITNFMKLKGKNVTVQQAVAIKLVQDALKGDKKAFELVVDMIGEKPANQINIKDITPVIFSGEDELME